MNKNIIIAGGDGFCGWPLALRLSKKKYNVIILDNFSRRKIDRELSTNSITPISSLKKRLATWKKITGKKIKFYNIDLANHTIRLESLIKKYKPKAIYMFAELKSAPYSMMSLKNANLNISNNLLVNNNMLHCINKYSPSTHYIHLGTMGVYGYDYSKKNIPEGYYKAKLINNYGEVQNAEILHPASPGSIYHLTKAMDELIFQFYQKIYNLKITDLHQGIVWGCNTEETAMDVKLYNRFDYDHIYGTFLNRLVAQATINFPLTLHGKGTQKRPFININDAVKSFELVLKNKKKNKVEIYNELGEVMQLVKIADFISIDKKVKILNIKNPRIENEKNTLKAQSIKLQKQGLKITKISKKNLLDLFSLAEKYKKRINKKKIIKTVYW